MTSQDVAEPTEQHAPAAADDLFRAINERIIELGQRFGLQAEPFLELICECENSCCVERIRIPSPTYEQLRGERGRRVVAVGHEGAGSVVSLGDGYAVVSD